MISANLPAILTCTGGGAIRFGVKRMRTGRWQRIEQIFQAAVEIPTAEQSGFLDRACEGDLALRHEVAKLLESDRQAQQGIKAAVDGAASSLTDDFRRELSSYIGLRIGPYEIVREIGRGGMGAVYQAVRVDDQYLHSVAVKFIAQGMDSPEALVRFRVERQILATLHHPNIAGLLDGGTTEDGRPYFLMEYIEGEPLVDYSRRKMLSVEQRLELFRSICAAVHHAHQSLVIHRDLKPHNVLVTAEGIPKLLDFGIAKLLAPELVPGTNSPTRTQMRMLTPEYASPEQVRGEPLTTASDIYSLGVILYELLSFSSPYRTTGKSSSELERAVCEIEPPRLSEAVRGDAKLRRELSGDLENIVAMALRKEPQRRYGSALQLSEDIQRYLKGLPVSARKDTLFYLAGKLVRRNKLASAAFALLAISVAGGWTATIREARRTEQRFREVRKLANSVLGEFHSQIQHLPGSTPARETLVRTALEYLNNLQVEHGEDPTLEWEISQAYELVGDVQGDPDGPNLGKYFDALTSYRKARAMVEEISTYRADRETLSCLAWLHYKIGDLEQRADGVAQAIQSYERGLGVSSQLARHAGDLEPAENLLRNGYQRIAIAQLRVANYDEALKSARRGADAADRVAKLKPGYGPSADIARSRLNLGNILWITGDLHGAMKHYQEAVVRLEELLQRRPNHVATQIDMVEAYRRTGDLYGNPSYFHFDNPQKAVEYLRRALPVAEQLVARDPNDAQALAGLSVTERRLGAVLRESEPQEAEKRYRRSIRITEELMKESPRDLTYQRDLANAKLGLGIALRNAGKSKPALDELTETLALQRDMMKRHPERAVIREDMFDTLLALGELRLGLWEGPALETLNEAMSLGIELTKQMPRSLYAQRCYALAARGLGDYYARLARRGPAADRTMNRGQAAEWYKKGLLVWSRWRQQHLAMPYAGNREKEVLQLIGVL